MKHLQLTEELQERALLYAAGAMDEKERRRFEKHLEEDDCTVCRSEVLESEAAAQSLAMTLPLQEPSDSVKLRLMAQANAVSAKRRERRGSRGFTGWAGWLAAAASVVLVLFLFNLNATLREEIGALNAKVVELEGRVGEQQIRLAALTESDRVITLAGQGATPGARARIFWNEAGRRWRVFVFDLPPAPAGRSYQLWFIPDGADPVSAQVFDTTPNGSAELNIALPAGATALMAAAVTNEPEGGRPQPTGDFVLLGTE